MYYNNTRFPAGEEPSFWHFFLKGSDIKEEDGDYSRPLLFYGGGKSTSCAMPSSLLLLLSL
jgi:hypothetical protein